ncbi:hypothetical protein [Salinibacterium sp. GXW1014]|uniref:hypothetical protein n=1 Tax=Salinibacterium sp. GXW1014 TaxID=3377838 RepID=UPI003839EEB3
MMDRTPHPEQPAEGTDQPAYTEEETADRGSEESGDDVADDIFAAIPGRLNQDLDDPSKSDPSLGPDHPIGSP